MTTQGETQMITASLVQESTAITTLIATQTMTGTLPEEAAADDRDAATAARKNIPTICAARPPADTMTQPPPAYDTAMALPSPAHDTAMALPPPSPAHDTAMALPPPSPARPCDPDLATFWDIFKLGHRRDALNEYFGIETIEDLDDLLPTDLHTIAFSNWAFQNLKVVDKNRLVRAVKHYHLQAKATPDLC